MDVERRMDRVEKRLDATLKIVQTGMKMLVKNEEAIHALIESQMRTDAVVLALGIKIDRLVDGLRTGGNGSGGGRR
jgi:hypothetical protein